MLLDSGGTTEGRDHTTTTRPLTDESDSTGGSNTTQPSASTSPPPMTLKHGDKATVENKVAEHEGMAVVQEEP